MGWSPAFPSFTSEWPACPARGWYGKAQLGQGENEDRGGETRLLG
jgi:hypothetical protein